jgi:hypothetical protein
MEIVTIEIESDCLQVVQSIIAKHTNYTEVGSIIDMCRQMLVTNNNWKVSYVRRQTNRIAYEIARTTRFIANPQFYNYCPSYIEPIVLNEITFICIKKKEKAIYSCINFEIRLSKK